MKCEYCENEVTTGVNRCPCCGGPISSNLHGQMTSAPINDMGIGLPEKLNEDCVVPHKGKNKWVFILLGVFLGGFGVHNFYAGYIARGVIKVLITIVSFGLLFWISWIWAIVEICTVRIDAVGYPFES